MKGIKRRTANNCRDCQHFDTSGDDEPCVSCYSSMDRPAWEPSESKRDKVGDHLRHQRRHDHRPDTGRNKANLKEANNAT